ncbi:hypothetical protein HKX48_008029 [Thoreauomyces humboldtii]|nr:hypothetical protein HKX48_008029 [Thoreauomyces humboldtii]
MASRDLEAPKKSSSPGTASDFNIVDLAAGVSKGLPKATPQVPLACALVTILLVIIAVIVVPSSTVFVTNAHETVELNAQVILEVTASKVYNDIVNLLNSSHTAAYSMGKRPSTTAVIQAALAGASLEQQVLSNDDCSYRRQNPPFVVQVAMDKWAIPINLTGLTPYGPFETSSVYTYDFMDSFTVAAGDISYYHHVLTDQGVLFPAWAQSVIWGLLGVNDTSAKDLFGSADPLQRSYWIYNPLDGYFNATHDVKYQYMQGANPGKESDRKWGVVNLSGALFGSVVTNIYAGASTTVPTHNCQAGGAISTSIDPFLTKAVPSTNGLIFLFDTVGSYDSTPAYTAGPMIASSVDGSVISPQTLTATGGTTATRYTVLSSPSSRVSEIGAFLAAKNPLLTFTGLNTYKTKLGGEWWYIATQDLHPDTAGAVWQIVFAFPRSDFFVGIDRSITKSVILIACLSIAGLLGILAFSYLITLPLTTLGVRMGEVTKMKFSSLEGKVLSNRNYIGEIASLENTFQTMVQAFAGGIKKNASMLRPPESYSEHSYGHGKSTTKTGISAVTSANSAVGSTNKALMDDSKQSN